MDEYLGWRKQHYEVIVDFLQSLNEVSQSYVLKGGTSLMLCYGLTRFSEDIDLDGFATDIEEIVKTFCVSNGFQYRVSKNTKTVKRYMINYGNVSKPLKVEVSYRASWVDYNTVTSYINGLLVYQLPVILSMKLSAYNGKDKIRDLYEVVFIGLNFWEDLDELMKFQMRDIVSRKGLEQFDYVIKDQQDELVNNDELAQNFLCLWEKLGLC